MSQSKIWNQEFGASLFRFAILNFSPCDISYTVLAFFRNFTHERKILMSQPPADKTQEPNTSAEQEPNTSAEQEPNT